MPSPVETAIVFDKREMKISVPFTLAILLSPCIAQSDDSDSCPPALYIQAGSQDEFPSPNANTTCTKAHIRFLESGAYKTISVEQGTSICADYPLIHISVPADTPVGPSKITWLCENDEPDPCQLLFIQSASASNSVSVTSLALSQECPTVQARTSSQGDTLVSSAAASFTEPVGSRSTMSSNTDAPQPTDVSTYESTVNPTGINTADAMSGPSMTGTSGSILSSPAANPTDYSTPSDGGERSTTATTGTNLPTPTAVSNGAYTTEETNGPSTASVSGSIPTSSVEEYNQQTTNNGCTCPPT